MRTICLLLLSACATSPERGFRPEVWEFTDPAAWTVRSDELELHGKSDYEPPHRSPLSLALMREFEFEDFELRVRARSTCREYAHRDLVIVFAWRDPAHYVYAHLATRADQNAHQVMLVDGAPRRPVTDERTEGVVWGDDWHDLRLLRREESVVVFFDDERVMTATVPPGPGRVGLGSFDDTGVFRDFVVEWR